MTPQERKDFLAKIKKGLEDGGYYSEKNIYGEDLCDHILEVAKVFSYDASYPTLGAFILLISNETSPDLKTRIAQEYHTAEMMWDLMTEFNHSGASWSITASAILHFCWTKD